MKSNVSVVVTKPNDIVAFKAAADKSAHGR